MLICSLFQTKSWLHPSATARRFSAVPSRCRRLRPAVLLPAILECMEVEDLDLPLDVVLPPLARPLREGEDEDADEVGDDHRR